MKILSVEHLHGERTRLTVDRQLETTAELYEKGEAMVIVTKNHYESLSVSGNEAAIAYKALMHYSNSVSGAALPLHVSNFAHEHYGPIQTAEEIGQELLGKLNSTTSIAELMEIAADYVKRYEAVTK